MEISPFWSALTGLYYRSVDNNIFRVALSTYSKPASISLFSSTKSKVKHGQFVTFNVHDWKNISEAPGEPDTAIDGVIDKKIRNHFCTNICGK